MKKYKIILLLSMALVFILTGFKEKRKLKISAEDKWSGTVSFSRTITGETRSEWRMDAKITNDTGTVLQTFKSQGSGGSCECIRENKTELEIGIDEKEYSIFVPAEGCHGTCSDGKKFGLTDETGIGIDNQPLKDHDILSGNLVIDTTYPTGTRWVDICTWNLTRVK
jgi:hypothetical protein